MFVKKILLFALTISIWSGISAQNRYTISGYVRDSLSRETLIGATIQSAATGKGISSNQYGFYSISLPEGRNSLLVSFVGYLQAQVDIDLKSDQAIDFSLLSRSSLGQEIIISM
jgi:hypothetical protein